MAELDVALAKIAEAPTRLAAREPDGISSGGSPFFVVFRGALTPPHPVGSIALVSALPAPSRRR